MKRLDFPVCLHIIARRRAIKVLEHGAEAGWVGETAAKHDVCYRLVRVGQQLFGILQTGIADEGMWCLVGQLLHSAVQMHTAQSYFAGNHIHTQVLIIHVIIDYLHHLFHQLVFWRKGFFYRNLPVALSLVAHKLVFQSTAHVEQVDDGATQNVHIERLHHIGIGTRLQTGQLVFLSACLLYTSDAADEL